MSLRFNDCADPTPTRQRRQPPGSPARVTAFHASLAPAPPPLPPATAGVSGPGRPIRAGRVLALDQSRSAIGPFPQRERIVQVAAGGARLVDEARRPRRESAGRVGRPLPRRLHPRHVAAGVQLPPLTDTITPCRALVCTWVPSRRVVLATQPAAAVSVVVPLQHEIDALRRGVEHLPPRLADRRVVAPATGDVNRVVERHHRPLEFGFVASVFRATPPARRASRSSSARRRRTPW